MNFFKRNLKTEATMKDIFNYTLTDINDTDLHSYSSAEALKNTDVISAMHMLASDVAGLMVTDKEENDDLLNLLNKSPNNLMSGYSFKYAIVSQLILDGNVYVEITRNDKGRAERLDILSPSDVQILKERNNTHFLNLYYHVNTFDGKQRKVDSKDMLHFKILSTDGIVGQSPLKALAQDLNTDKYGKKFLAGFFKDGTMSSGFLKSEDDLTPQQKDVIRKEWQKQNSGVSNSNKVAVLDKRLEFERLEIDTELIKLLNSNKTSKIAVASVLGIPLHKMGLSANNLDIAKVNQDYLISTLNVYLKIILSELYKLDTQVTTEFDFNTDSYKNIDTKQLHENIKIERELGLISVDEARSKLGLRPLENDIGNQYITNLNFVNSDIANEYQLNKTQDKGGEITNE